MILLLFFTMLCTGSQASDDRYQFQVQPVVRALEGLCVFVPCTFKYPQDSRKSTYGYWFRLSRKSHNQKEELVASNHYWDPPSTKGRFQLVGKPEDGNCSLLITDVQNTDQGLYYFRVERYQSMKNSYNKSTVSLEVTDRTQPDVYILEPLWPNRWGTVICVFNATFDLCSAPSFSWMGQVLSTGRSEVSTHRSSVLKIIPQPQDLGTNLTCSVRFSPWRVIFQKTVRLDVAYEKRTLRVAFTNGVLVGTGIAGFLSLCVILILVIFLRRRSKQTKHMSRSNTILDNINIFPSSGSQALNQEVEPHGASQPPPQTPSPQPRKNQKQKPQEGHCALSHAEATPSLPASQEQEGEVQYSHLHFPGHRPRVLQAPNDRHEEYVEIRFY